MARDTGGADVVLPDAARESDLDSWTPTLRFLGVPYDQGTYARPGARFGPNGIRYVDRIYDYMDAFEDKEAQGYFDIDRKEMMLRGVTMAPTAGT